MKLRYQTGSIIADNGQTVASMNRKAGDTPLSPVERDNLAKLFAASPELLIAVKIGLKNATFMATQCEGAKKEAWLYDAKVMTAAISKAEQF